MGAGAALCVVVVLIAFLSGNAATFDLVPVLLFSVVVGASLGGRRGGVVAAVVASLSALAYYSQPAWVGTPGNGPRVLLLLAASGLTVLIVGSLRQTADHLRSRIGVRRGFTEAVQAFNGAIGEAPDEGLFEAIVAQARQLVSAEVVVLTVLDPRSGRHVVRAVDGTPASALGVEVLSGVGITGQAIRDRRLVVTGGSREAAQKPRTITESLFQRVRASQMRQVERRGDALTMANQTAPSTAANGSHGHGRPLASMPALHGGRVTATLTVGRFDGQPHFGDHEHVLLELVAPTIALTINNWLLRRQLREASIRDPLSGLYTRAYLDAALEQLLALRRRTSAQERKPLSLILFDIDEFRAFNEQHGRKAGDAVVRAMGALLRQRFRASDLTARLSGDGFLVVMDGADLEVAERAAQEIRLRVQSLALTDERGVRFNPSISAGCATFRNDAERSDAIIRSVEAALDTARWSGPGAIVSI